MDTVTQHWEHHVDYTDLAGGYGSFAEERAGVGPIRFLRDCKFPLCRVLLRQYRDPLHYSAEGRDKQLQKVSS